MLRYNLLFPSSLLLVIVACSSPPPEAPKPVEIHVEEEPVYNLEVGIGAFTSFDIPSTIDTALVSKGKQIYTEKCAVCHKLTEEVLTGPGWTGITSRRAPVWIMNYLTNTDEMLDTDPSLKEMIIKYKTRMTNLNLTGEEARAVLEFMRKNDAEVINVK